MKNVSLLFNLYQPPYQREKDFRDVVEKCYIPLLNFIKSNRTLTGVTVNIPLSVLEQLDKYGYTDWIEGLKSLVVSDRVEIAGSAAYKVDLMGLPKSLAEKQIIFNEYGLGYYFGNKNGFDGEHAILVKNVVGVVPPTGCVDRGLLTQLSEMSYKWVLLHNTFAHSAADSGSVAGMLADTGVTVIEANVTLQKLLMDDITITSDALARQVSVSCTTNPVFSLDIEQICACNTRVFKLLDNMLLDLHKLGIIMPSVSNAISVDSNPSSESFSLPECAEPLQWVKDAIEDAKSVEYQRLAVLLMALYSKTLDVLSQYTEDASTDSAGNVRLWGSSTDKAIQVQGLTMKVLDLTQFAIFHDMSVLSSLPASRSLDKSTSFLKGALSLYVKLAGLLSIKDYEGFVRENVKGILAILEDLQLAE